MAIDDPKTRVRPAEPKDETPDMATVLAQMAAMQQQTAELLLQMRQTGSGDSTVIEKLIEQQERLLVKSMPENPQPTGISAFFTLEDKEKYGTKPTLRCKTVWAGREVYGDVETPEEILLLNALPHGDFKVTRADGVKITFQVRHRKDDNDNLIEVNAWFPCSKEKKHNHGSMISYCRQALGVAEPTVAELNAEVARLKAELAATMAGMTRTTSVIGVA